MEETMLTTFDNTFSPFDDFERWWKEDLRLGHDCCGVLARNAMTSVVFGDKRNDEIVTEAMNELVKREPAVYRIVKRSDFSQKEGT